MQFARLITAPSGPAQLNSYTRIKTALLDCAPEMGHPWLLPARFTFLEFLKFLLWISSAATRTTTVHCKYAG